MNAHDGGGKPTGEVARRERERGETHTHIYNRESAREREKRG